MKTNGYYGFWPDYLLRCHFSYFSVSLTGVAPWTVTYSNLCFYHSDRNKCKPYHFQCSQSKTNVTYTITGLMTKLFSTWRNKRLYNHECSNWWGWWTGLVSTDWFDCKQGYSCRHLLLMLTFQPFPIMMELKRIPKIDVNITLCYFV
jgi:hypothetical protein